jgi:hypothetical protein
MPTTVTEPLGLEHCVPLVGSNVSEHSKPKLKLWPGREQLID